MKRKQSVCLMFAFGSASINKINYILLLCNIYSSFTLISDKEQERGNLFILRLFSTKYIKNFISHERSFQPFCTFICY